MIVLATARLVLPIASAWCRWRRIPAPQLVRLYRSARRTREARILLARANRAAERGSYARARKLMQRVAEALAANVTSRSK